MPGVATHLGSCHCGRVKFRIEADVSKLVKCTCSICTKKGVLHIGVEAENFTLLEGEDDLTLYQFNENVARHTFCKHCGIHAFGNPRTNPARYVVNANCLDDFDVAGADYELEVFDGRNWEAAQAARLAKSN